MDYDEWPVRALPRNRSVTIGVTLAILGVVFGAVGFLFWPALILSATCFLIVLLIEPRSFLWVVVLFNWLLYLPYLGQELEALKFSVGAVNVFPHDLMFAALAIAVAYGAIAHQSRFKFALSTVLGKFILLFFLYQIIQMAWSFFAGVPIDTVVREGSKYLVCIYAFYIILFFDSESMSKLLKAGYVLVMALPLIQVYMFSTGDVWQTSSGTDRTFFIGANIFFLAIIIHHLIQPRLQAKSALVILYMLAGMAMTQYRSAFLALLVVLGAVAVVMFQQGRVRKVLIGGVAMLLAFAVAIAVLSVAKPEFLSQSLTRYGDTFNTEDLNVTRRQYMWRVSLEAFMARPIAGVGVAQNIYSFTEDGKDLSADRQWSPHNFMLKLMAKEGVIGAGLMLGILIATWRSLRRSGRKTAPLCPEPVRQGLLIFFVALTVIHLMNATFTAEKTYFVQWVFEGLILLLMLEAANRERTVPGKHLQGEMQ